MEITFERKKEGFYKLNEELKGLIMRVEMELETYNEVGHMFKEFITLLSGEDELVLDMELNDMELTREERVEIIEEITEEFMEEGIDFKKMAKDCGVVFENIVDYADDIKLEAKERSNISFLFGIMLNSEKNDSDFKKAKKELSELIKTVETMSKNGEKEKTIYAISEIKFAKHGAEQINENLDCFMDGFLADIVFGTDYLIEQIRDITQDSVGRRKEIAEEVTKNYDSYGELSLESLKLI